MATLGNVPDTLITLHQPLYSGLQSTSVEMNSALPPNLINPAFAELEETAAADDTTFAKETTFLFKCWQCMG